MRVKRKCLKRSTVKYLIEYEDGYTDDIGLDLDDLKELKYNLIRLRKDQTNKSYGICYNLDHPKAYEFVRVFSWGWKKHTGNADYPVPRINERLDFFGILPDLWSGEEGELRKELLEFLIRKVKREIKRIKHWRRTT